MKNIKRNKNEIGITLVALVITIVLLLILAGISIATLTGSGLFEKARLAEQESKNKQEEEQGILGDYENKIGEYVNGSRQEDFVSLTSGTAKAEDIAYGKTAWVNGEQITGKALVLGEYIATYTTGHLNPSNNHSITVENLDVGEYVICIQRIFSTSAGLTFQAGNPTVDRGILTPFIENHSLWYNLTLNEAGDVTFNYEKLSGHSDVRIQVQLFKK